MHPDLDPNDQTVLKIIQETAPIAWRDLQRFFASGQAIEVDKSLDLIYVAKKFNDNDTSIIESWLNKGLIKHVSDLSAAHWFENQSTLWASVILPWVLVQDKQQPKTQNDTANK